MTDRRTFVHVGTLALLAASLRAHAQKAGAMPRIGLLTPGNNPREPAFWQGMRDLGYVDGKNIVVDRRSAEGDLARLPVLAAEIVKNRPDVIVALVTASAIAAQKATSTIPIVMVGVSDPVVAGLVGNLARPTGNVTGTVSQTYAVVGKLVELIRQLRPNAARVSVLWDPVNAISQQLSVAEILVAAARLHVIARMIEVGSRDDLDRAFTAMASAPPDAVVVSSDTFFLANAGRIAELGLSHRIPVFSTRRQMAEAGILAIYGSDLVSIARRSAGYVQKILRGAKPGDLPVQLPTKFELVINLKTARALGIEVPASVVARADEVIR